LAEELTLDAPGETDANLEDAWAAQLAGQVLAESANLKRIGRRNQPKLDRVRDCLVHILQGEALPAVERALAGRSLAILGDPRPEATDLEGMRLAFVPKGPFVMGEGKERHENPYLDYDYWIGVHPVTNAQYAAFIAAGGYVDETLWTEAIADGHWGEAKFKGRYEDAFRYGPEDFGAPFNFPNHPVVGVSWYDALAFTRWLTAKWRAQGFLPAGWSLRLPTEGEWEKAARGGINIPKTPLVLLACCVFQNQPVTMETVANPRPERAYPWGDRGSTDRVDRERAHFSNTPINASSAVGCFSKGQSPHGCQDMSGNVWEWTRTCFKEYGYNPKDGREDLKAGDDIPRVLRGGTFYHSGRLMRCAYRGRSGPAGRSYEVGFRVVFTPNISDF
jgi:formylglycine-generating enzyme required for sulfatase activity